MRSLQLHIGGFHYIVKSMYVRYYADVRNIPQVENDWKIDLVVKREEIQERLELENEAIYEDWLEKRGDLDFYYAVDLHGSILVKDEDGFNVEVKVESYDILDQIGEELSVDIDGIY